jgi:hypothetical protein
MPRLAPLSFPEWTEGRAGLAVFYLLISSGAKGRGGRLLVGRRRRGGKEMAILFLEKSGGEKLALSFCPFTDSALIARHLYGPLL